MRSVLNTSKLKVLLSSTLVSFFVCTLLFSNSYALSDYNVYTGLRTLSYYGYDGSSSVNNCNNGSNKYYLDYFRTSNFDVHKGKMVIAIGFQNSNNNNSFDGYIPVSWSARPYIAPASGVQILVLDVEVVSNSPSQSTLYLLVDSNYSWSNGSLVLTPATEVQLNPGECWEKGYTTDIGISYVQLQDISEQLDSITGSFNSLNSSINSINNNVNSVNDNIQQSNDDANDRYQDEKDTIQSDGDNAVGAWDDAQENLSFDAPTFLFGWLWSLGSVEDCVQIPVLASLLHSTETQYCTWYPTSIRSIISPIINIFLVVLISGFVVSWLKKGGV